MTILTEDSTKTAQAELEQYIEDQSDNEVLISDLSDLATDLDRFLRKHDRSQRTIDPELHDEVSQELENLKARIKGLAVCLGFVGEVLDTHDRGLKEMGLSLQIVPSQN